MPTVCAYCSVLACGLPSSVRAVLSPKTLSTSRLMCSFSVPSGMSSLVRRRNDCRAARGASNSAVPSGELREMQMVLVPAAHGRPDLHVAGDPRECAALR